MRSHGATSLLQRGLSCLLWNANFQTAGRGLALGSGVDTLQGTGVFLGVAAPTGSAGRRQGGVPAPLAARGCRAGRRRQAEVGGGLSQFILLHQQGVAAGGGAEPAPGGGAGGGAGAQGPRPRGAIPVTKGVQQRQVKALPVPANPTVPVITPSGGRILLWGDGGYLDAGAFKYSGPRNLPEGERKKKQLQPHYNYNPSNIPPPLRCPT